MIFGEINNTFGLCHCGNTDGYRNIGRDHWFYCEKCKTKWYVGSNIFSAWREEKEKIWRKNYLFLKNYKEIESL